MERSLFINKFEALRIICEDGDTKYCIVSNGVMCEVTLSEFVRYYADLRNVYFNSHDERQLNDYLDFGDLLQNMITL